MTDASPTTPGGIGATGSTGRIIGDTGGIIGGGAGAAPVLTATGITLSRRHRTLLSGFDLTLSPGETVTVMGRSGAGKTTLLRTLAGLASPDTGRIERPAGRVPFVFQDPRLLPWRTAEQNVALVLVADEKRSAASWLAAVGLADAAHTYPQVLSGGMRQRVAIARALACRAPLLLVDEPFSHLDLATARTLRRELIRHLADTGTAAIWVTHDPAEAAEAADRTLVMDGPPDGTWTVLDHAAIGSDENVARSLAHALHRDGADSSDADNGRAGNHADSSRASARTHAPTPAPYEEEERGHQ